MSDLERARQLFHKAGLGFPAIPEVFAVQLKERGRWLYSTRPLTMSPYNLGHYVNELELSPVEDYAVLAHSGHGANSYAIQYYVVQGPLRMFLHLGWGGAYMDNEAAAAGIRDCFAAADQVVAAGSRSEMFEAEGRLTIVAEENVECYWLPPGEVERRRTEGPLRALTDAHDWLTRSPSR